MFQFLKTSRFARLSGPMVLASVTLAAFSVKSANATRVTDESCPRVFDPSDPVAAPIPQLPVERLTGAPVPLAEAPLRFKAKPGPFGRFASDANGGPQFEVPQDIYASVEKRGLKTLQDLAAYFDAHPEFARELGWTDAQFAEASEGLRKALKGPAGELLSSMKEAPKTPEELEALRRALEPKVASIQGYLGSELTEDAVVFMVMSVPVRNEVLAALGAAGKSPDIRVMFNPRYKRR